MKNLLIYSLLFFITVSCNKPKGCLDRLARNYDPAAKKEATCYYDGKVVFWIDPQTANNNEGTPVQYFIDGKLQFNDSLHLFLFEDPECDDERAKTYTHDMGTSTSTTIRYQVKDRRYNIVIADSTVTLKAGYCIPHKVVY